MHALVNVKKAHTSGEATGGYRDLVMISSLFVGWRHRIDGRRGTEGRLRVRNSGGGRPFDRFYADNFGAGRGFGAFDARRANQSHAAAVEFLEGVFGGAFEANFVTVKA